MGLSLLPTVAPGASIGTCNVNGPVTFQAGSTYEVEANAGGQSDRIAATGAAALTGGTVQVLARTATYARQTRYTILTANGGVTGTFASVTSNSRLPHSDAELRSQRCLPDPQPQRHHVRVPRPDPEPARVAGALDRGPPLAPWCRRS